MKFFLSSLFFLSSSSFVFVSEFSIQIFVFTDGSMVSIFLFVLNMMSIKFFENINYHRKIADLLKDPIYKGIANDSTTCPEKNL